MRVLAAKKLDLKNLRVSTNNLALYQGPRLVAKILHLIAEYIAAIEEKKGAQYSSIVRAFFDETITSLKDPNGINSEKIERFRQKIQKNERYLRADGRLGKGFLRTAGEILGSPMMGESAAEKKEFRVGV